MTTAIQRLAHRLHEMTADRTADIAADRFKVLRADPLLVQQLRGDLVLEEGDPDFEIADAVDTAGAAIGDIVVVHRAADGDWIATAVVKRGDDG